MTTREIPPDGELRYQIRLRGDWIDTDTMIWEMWLGEKRLLLVMP